MIIKCLLLLTLIQIYHGRPIHDFQVDDGALRIDADDHKRHNHEGRKSDDDHEDGKPHTDADHHKGHDHEEKKKVCDQGPSIADSDDDHH